MSVLLPRVKLWGNYLIIMRLLWSATWTLRPCWLCVGGACTHARTHAHTHTHTLTHTRTLLWIVANSIIAWSNHFQIQWRHLCQVHRRSRKHTHTETQTQTHTHIHTHTHTTFPLENDTLICIFLLSWDRGHLKAFYSSSFIELREKLPSHHAAGTTENWQTETLMAESHEATVPAGL